MRSFNLAGSLRLLSSRKGPRAGLQIAPFHSQLARAARQRITPGLVHLKKWKPRRPRPLPPGWQPFTISNTLLDLDAYDAQNVRPYDDAEHARQKRKWAARPAQWNIQEATKNFSRAFKKVSECFHRLATAQGSGKWRVDEMDILSVALLQTAGPMSAFPSPKATDTTDPDDRVDYDWFLEMNAVPPKASMAHKELLGWLLLRRRQFPLVKLTEPHARRKLMGVNAGYAAWRRQLVSFLRPGGRVDVLEHAEKSLFYAFFNKHLKHEHRTRELLILLGNLRVRLEQEGLSLPPRLGCIALVYAAMLEDMNAIQSYLTLVLKSGFWTTSSGSSVPSDPALYDATLIPGALGRNQLQQVHLLRSLESIRKWVLRQASQKRGSEPQVPLASNPQVLREAPSQELSS